MSVTTLLYDPLTNRLARLGPSLLAAGLAVGLAVGSTVPVCADHRDSFESAQPTWRLAESDCEARIVVQRRDFQVYRSGAASEHVSLVANQGTYAFLILPIPQGRVLAEWTAALWVKADRTGPQLLARVVLPRTRDPQTGGPMTVLLRGDVYDRSGLWQQLTIRQADLNLERQVRVLRSQFGPDLDAREAYADLLVVNAYGGVGVTNVWLDDLELLGQIAPTRLASRSAEAARQQDDGLTSPDDAWSWAPAHRENVRLNGSLLLVEDRPFFPRVIEHNGESLEWLQSLGFNAVRLSAAPTGVQLREAARLGLWLIAPPPNDDRITAAHDRVLAWDLGFDLQDARLESTRQRAAQLRRTDPRTDRPLIGEAVERLWNYSRFLNFLVLHRAPLGTACTLPEYGEWLRTRPSLARAGTPFWATIQTEASLELVDQWSASGLRPPPSIGVEPAQIRLLTFQAITSGARGLIFRSRTPLDQPDDEAQTRVRLLKRLNIELSLVEPWVAGGMRGDDVQSPAAEVRIGVLQTERSQLFLVLEQSDTQQYTVGPVKTTSLSLVLPSAATAPQVYCLTPAGLQTLPHRRVPGGIRVSFERYDPVCLVAITQDPLVLNHLVRTWADNRVTAAKLQAELAAVQLQSVQTLRDLSAGRTPGDSAADQWLAQAQDYLRQSQVLLGGSDYPAAQTFAERTLDRLAQVRQHDWDQAIRDFPTPAASPFCAGFPVLSLHWELARRLQAAPNWSPNALAAGDFDNLDHLRATGWQNRSRADAAARTRVELSPASFDGRGTCLRMQAAAADPNSPPAAIEAPLLEIVSPPIAVRRGQLVQVRGWVRIPERLTASPDGLTIYDSVGGPMLGQRFGLTDGWREFVFFRTAPTDGNFALTFALTGLGEASLDNVAVSLHDPISPQGRPDEARRLPPTGEHAR